MANLDQLLRKVGGERTGQQGRKRLNTLLDRLGGARVSYAPGESATQPIQEQHPDVGASTRAIIMNLSSDPETGKRYLESKGLQVKRYGAGFKYAVKRPEEREWRVVDPKGFDVQDITDIGGDIASIGSIGLGAGLGTGGGPAGIVAGGALGGAGAGSIKAGLGKAFGLDPTAGEVGRSVAFEGATGALAGVGGKVVSGAVRGLGRGITYPFRKVTEKLMPGAGREAARPPGFIGRFRRYGEEGIGKVKSGFRVDPQSNVRGVPMKAPPLVELPTGGIPEPTRTAVSRLAGGATERLQGLRGQIGESARRLDPAMRFGMGKVRGPAGLRRPGEISSAAERLKSMGGAKRFGPKEQPSFLPQTTTEGYPIPFEPIKRTAETAAGGNVVQGMLQKYGPGFLGMAAGGAIAGPIGGLGGYMARNVIRQGVTKISRKFGHRLMGDTTGQVAQSAAQGAPSTVASKLAAAMKVLQERGPQAYMAAIWSALHNAEFSEWVKGQDEDAARTEDYRGRRPVAQ